MLDCPINEIIFIDIQEKYHSDVGKLICVVKYLSLNIAKADEKLSKVLDEANITAYKKIHQIIIYVLDKREYGEVNNHGS